MDLASSTRGIRAPIDARMIQSADGTRIAAFRIGKGPITWVMPPAMGAPLISMKGVFEHLSDRCTILTWDMRGFFASGAPQDPDAYRIDDHLADMDAVIDAFGAPGKFALGGWSMAVQLSLESVHRHPERVAALVLIAGPYGRALSAVLPGVHGPFARMLEKGAYRAGPLVTRLVRRALAPAWLPPLAGRLGLLARPERMPEVIERFREIDWGRYLTVVRHLHEHDAESYLGGIRCPALVVCGTKDILTPLSTAKYLHQQIAGSELLIIPKATHYVVVEYGELLAARIARFLEAHV
jgi:pimeloyl-ACP methyl ester carboxylesterase